MRAKKKKKKKESFTWTQREMLTVNSWLDVVIKQKKKKESGEWRAGFFSPAVFLKKYKIWVVWESEHQRLLRARCGGTEGGGRRGSTSLQLVVPTKEKKDWVKGKGRKEEGTKERALLFPRKEHGLDRVLLRRLSPDGMIGSLYRLQ